MNKVKLSDEQKERLMRAIRWQYVSQETLLRLSADSDFVHAKSLIVQGLAIRLGGSDSISPEELKLTLKPRRILEHLEAQRQAEEEDAENQDQNNEEDEQTEVDADGNAVAPQNPKNIGRDIFKDMRGSSAQNFYPADSSDNIDANRSHSALGQKSNQRRTASPNSRPHTSSVNQNAYANQANQRFNQVYRHQIGF